MTGLLRAEWLKTKRSTLRLLVLGLPLLIGAVLAGYISARAWMISPDGAFSGFFGGWGALVMPVAIALVAGQLADEEEQAGNFGALLLSARPRWRLYLAKFAALAAALAVATAFAVGMFCAVLAATGYQESGFTVYACAAAACFVGALPLAALQLWIAFAGGFGVSVGTGMGGLLIAALLGATMLGDQIWPFIPWAWPVRFASTCAIVRIPGIPSEQLAIFMENVHLACAVAFVSGTLLMIGGTWWFIRWDGRAGQE